MTFDGRVEAQFVVPAGVTIAATNSGGGPTAVSLTPGTYFPSTFIAHVVGRLNAVRTPANWTGSISTGPSGTGRVSLLWTGTGTYSIAWTDPNVGDVLGHPFNLVAVTQGVTSVGAEQARMLWIPDCPLNLDMDTTRAPVITDALVTVSPRGDATTLVGNSMYRHTMLRWSHVLEARIWEAAATTPNASWETFWSDAHLGLGTLSWFGPGSRLQVYDHAGRRLGLDAAANTGVGGWVATKGPTSIEPKRVSEAWAGLWRIEIPELVSAG